jgi:ATP/maltotriose-dependent transcriptional regulator MalT
MRRPFEMTELQEQATSAANRHIIERPRLTRLLDETTARVIMLVAPAGYGKTVLARQWLSDKAHVWFEAGDASSDVVGLATALASALEDQPRKSDLDLVQRARIALNTRHDLEVLAELQAKALGPWPRDGGWRLTIMS